MGMMRLPSTAGTKDVWEFLSAWSEVYGTEENTSLLKAMGHSLDAARTNVRRFAGDVGKVRRAQCGLDRAGPLPFHQRPCAVRVPPFLHLLICKVPGAVARLNTAAFPCGSHASQPELCQNTAQDFDIKRRKSMAAITRGLNTPNLPPGVTLQRQSRSVGKVLCIIAGCSFLHRMQSSRGKTCHETEVDCLL